MNDNSYHAEGDLSRFEASPFGIVVHTNESLVCRVCAFRWRPVGSCEKYPERKPGRRIWLFNVLMASSYTFFTDSAAT